MVTYSSTREMVCCHSLIGLLVFARVTTVWFGQLNAACSSMCIETFGARSREEGVGGCADDFPRLQGIMMARVPISTNSLITEKENELNHHQQARNVADDYIVVLIPSVESINQLSNTMSGCVALL